VTFDIGAALLVCLVVSTELSGSLKGADYNIPYHASEDLVVGLISNADC
jgi:hypothetical protein